MRIRIAELVSSLLISLWCPAQVQYWGVATGVSEPGNPAGFGAIVRTDSLGLGAQVVHSFDTSGVGFPNLGCGLMLASNGLLYFKTQYNDLPYHSYIHAFDPVTDSLWLVAEQGTAGFTWRGQRSYSSMIEGPAGFLIDATGYFSPAMTYRFNINNNQLSTIASIPPEVDSNGSSVWPTLNGTLINASNGLIYGAETPWLNSLGGIARIDPVASTYAVVPLPLDPVQGWMLNGEWQQVGTELYGTAQIGGTNNSQQFAGRGTIGSIDMGTHAWTKKTDLDSIVHNPVRGFVTGNTGLLFSEAQGDSVVVAGEGAYYGCVFSYDPNTNTVQRCFGFNDPGLGFAITGPALQPGLLAASNGKIYGSFRNGLFEFDPVADTVLLRAPLLYNDTSGNPQGYGLQAPLIEVCRKPNYKQRSTTSFQVCAGAHFFYDLQNVNATGVVWRRNGIVVPSQTSQLLEFTAITATDAGVWTCIMSNECGVTEPPAITITVNAGAFTTSTISGDTLLCGNSDSATLTGNNGGTWSSGGTSTTLVVIQPGSYFVWNAQACGMSMSNAINVVDLDSVFAQAVYGGLEDSLVFCLDATAEFTGNSPSPWGNLTTGVWQDGSNTDVYTVQDTGLYFVVVSNACNTDTSNTVQVYYPDIIAFPPVYFTDAIGNGADNLLCLGDSVRLNAPSGANYTVYLDGQYVCNLNDFANYTTSTPGTYMVLGADPCLLIADTMYFTIVVDSLLPPAATILPDLSTLTGCDQDTVLLTSTAASAYWYWTDGFGVTSYDSSATVQVDWEAQGYTLVPYNGCGEGPLDFIQLQTTPAPDVQYTELLDTICLSDGAQTLSTATPSGGTYSGAGVTGNSFDPFVAGVGAHTITYSYSDGTCTGYAQAVVVVDVCMGLATTQAPAVEVALLPNPNNGTFSLVISGTVANGSAVLYNPLGKQWGAVVPVKQGSNELEYPGLGVGVYTLRLQVDGRAQSLPFVVVE